MNKPRFLLDIDGVCANWLASAVTVIHKVTGKLYASGSG